LWILDRGKVVARSEDGRPLRMIGTHADVSVQRAALAALRESDDRFRALIEDLPVGVVLQDAADRVLVANPAACEILGLAPHGGSSGSADPRWELTDEHGAPLRPEDAPSVRAARSRAPVHNVVLSARRLDNGARRWLQVSAHPRFRPDGDLLWTLVSFVDVTAGREAEEERRRTEEQIRRAQKLESLAVLAGGVAHDFNNLLTAVIGHAGLVRQALADGGDPRAGLAAIERAATSAAGLAQQMLAYSGRAALRRARLDLAAVARDLGGLLRTAVDRRAELRFNLFPAPVVGDPSRLEQVVLNLLTNAAEAMEGRAGTIEIRTYARRFTAAELRTPEGGEPLPAGDYACLEVVDDGPGVAPDARSRIFDPFFSTKFAGRGLGLAVVLGTARGHGGGVLVENAPGRGAAFRVVLPLAAEEAASPAPPRIAPTSPCVRVEGPAASAPLVLVIDDEPDVRELMRRVLERGGFSVLAASDGEAGAELFARHAERIAVVVTDLTMPKLDGRQAAARIRALRAGTPVILTTGYSDVAAEAASEASDGGAVAAVLAKPFRGAELLALVRAATARTALLTS
jgi:signal transduction histidine kinase/ActR/RegA family two-component response regulator